MQSHTCWHPADPALVATGLELLPWREALRVGLEYYRLEYRVL
jgi:hypothetical protein